MVIPMKEIKPLDCETNKRFPCDKHQSTHQLKDEPRGESHVIRHFGSHLIEHGHFATCHQPVLPFCNVFEILRPKHITHLQFTIYKYR